MDTAKFNRSLTAKNLGVRVGTPQFIVLHDTAGSGTANDAKYLANDPERRGISVDFCIDKEGTIFQLNPNLATRCTHHAGRNTFFRQYANRNVNNHSIGIEIAQKANMVGLNPPYPDVQVKAVAFVCRYLCETFKLAKTDITTHAKIITDGSRSDPRKFPWDKFWTYFNEPDDAEKEPFDTKMVHIVQAGDTLYALATKYTTTVERIKALNDMNDASNLIKVGQQLIVKE